LGEEFTLQKKAAWKMNRPEPFACAGEELRKNSIYTRVTTVPRVSAFARDSSHCVSIAAAFIVSAESARTYILTPLNCLHDQPQPRYAVQRGYWRQGLPWSPAAEPLSSGSWYMHDDMAASIRQTHEAEDESWVEDYSDVTKSAQRSGRQCGLEH